MRSAAAFATANLFADQRVAPRVVFHRKGSLIHSNGSKRSIKIIDISTSGVGFFCSDQLENQQRYTLHIPTYRPELSEIVITGKVIYSILTGLHGFRVGIHFKDIDPKAKNFIERIVATAP